MRPNITIFLNKDNYLKNNYLIRRYIRKNETESYIRHMVRQDNYFVFEHLLVENTEKWLKMKKFYYKNIIYSNYLKFLESYCIDNESTKCRILITQLFYELGLSKNQHKKKNSKYIRWRR